MSGQTSGHIIGRGYITIAGLKDGDPAKTYVLLPSVESVTKKLDGTLSASSVSCSVYKVTGSSAYALSGDHVLMYRRMPDGVSGSLAHASGTSSAIAVLATTESIEFELKDGTKVLDRVRIPVLSDATDVNNELDKYKYLRDELKKQGTTIEDGLILSSLIALGYTDDNNVRHTLAGINGLYIPALGGRTIGSWWGGSMVDLFDKNDNLINPTPADAATSLIRMDGTGYFVNGLFRIKKTGLEIGDTANGYGISMGIDGRLTLGNGIDINIGGSAKGLADSISSVTELANKLSNLFTPFVGNEEKTWSQISDISLITSIRVNAGLWTEQFLSAKGRSSGSGSGSGSQFGLYTNWLSTPQSTDALGAVLGKSLYTQQNRNISDIASLKSRVTTLEGKNYLSDLTLSPSGSGNAVTAVTLSADKKTLTVTKGSSFALSSHTHSQYLTSITKSMVEAVLTGNITSHSHNYLSVRDLRDATRLPSYFDGQRLTAWFNNTGMPTSNWFSGIHVKGWQGSYASWELAATSNTNVNEKSLYFRVGIDSEWQGWQKVLTSGNEQTLTIQRNGTTAGTYKPSAAATINISDVASAATLSSHTGNTTVHITASERTAWNNKVDKVSGKGLSTNDFDNTLLSKLNGIEPGANKYVLPTASSTVLGGVKVGSGLAISSGVLSVNLSASHIPNLSWSKITSGKPTTLAGYGITDAKISGGVITLGTNTITPLVDHQPIYSLTFASGAFSAKTFNPKSAAATVNIPTTTSHIAEGTNKYFTDAKAVAALKSTTDALKASINDKLDTTIFDKFLTLFNDMFERVKIGGTDAAPVYAIHAKKGLYTDQFLTAKGRPSGLPGDSGSGSSQFGLMRSWPSSSPGADTTDALGANLGYQLYINKADKLTVSGLSVRLAALEQKNYLDNLAIAVSGSGNAVTAVSQSADKKMLTFTKGATFLTSHQSLANYVTLSGTQTITGAKTFSLSIKTNGQHGAWLSGKSAAAIMFNGLTAIDSSSAWYFYNMKSASGHTIAFGGLGDNIGFHTFLADRTENATDSSLLCNTATGQWKTNKPFTADGFVKSGSSNSYVLLGGGSHKAVSDFALASSLSSYLKVDGSNGSTAGVSALLNKLGTGTSTPTDADYYICQSAGGGTTTTTYYRRPTSAMWAYIKTKADAVYQPKGSYAASGHTHTFASLTSKPTTLVGFGITDAYTKTEVNNNFLHSGDAMKYAGSLMTTSTYYAYKITTTWPKANSSGMPLINIRGYAYGRSATIDIDITCYQYADVLQNLAAVSKGSWKPEHIYWTFENGYVVFYLVPDQTQYFFSLHAFVYRGQSMNRAHMEGWTIEALTAKPTVSGMTEIPWREISGYISNAEQAENAAKLGGVAASGYARTQMPNNFVHAGNEITMIPDGFSNQLWLNYRAGANGTGTISIYHMGDGNHGYANVKAKGFIKNGSSDSYILLGGGGHKALSDITSAYVTALGTNGNYLTWTKNGTVNNVTVPYATNANQLTRNTRMDYGWDGLNYFNASLSAGCAAKTNDAPTTQWWHILRFNHANSTGYYTDLAVPFNSDSLYWKCVKGGSLAHSSWVKILDDLNYSSILDARYYTESEVNAKNYIKDVGNATNTYFAYSKAGLTTTSWFAAWNGYELRAISPSAVLSTINALPRTGGSMANANLVTNLNADLLDGVHASGFIKYSHGATLAWDFGSSLTHLVGFEGGDNKKMRVYNAATTRTFLSVYSQSEINTKLTNGSVTKVGTATVGSATKPMYLNGGVPTASNATVGSSSRLMYLNSGTLTASSSTIGASNKPVYLSGGYITAVSSVGEAYLSWGGKSISGGLSPIDCAASNLHSANRIAFASPEGITIEYSRNGGSTWTDYGASATTKTQLVSGQGTSLNIGGTTTGVTTAYRLRVTLDASTMGVYTRARKLLLNISSNGASGCKVLVETATKGSPSSFTTVNTYDISGWSGWNSIPLAAIYFGGSSSQTSNTGFIRLTFYITALSSNTSYNNALSLADIVMLGDTYWTSPSTLAKTGHMYSYDASQNVTFPAKVIATAFKGTLEGMANSAQKLSTPRSINGSTFDGTASITTAKWGTARNIGILSNDGTSTPSTVSVDGSGNVNLRLPATIKAALTGNATTATGLQTAQTLTVGNTGKKFNGTANVTWSLDEIGVYSKSAADSRYVNVSGDTMTGLLTTTSGNHGGLKIGGSYLTANGNDMVLQVARALRFGADAWDANQWAGLKYTHSTKTIALGIADGTEFIANTAQTGGTLKLVNCNLLLGGGNKITFGSDDNAYLNYNSEGKLVLFGKSGINLNTNGRPISANANIATTGTFSSSSGGRSSLPNLSVSYTNNSYTLSTSSFICNSWVRTVGSSGWYSETYGGGWRMTDSTYIRNYGTKRVLLDAGGVFNALQMANGGGIYVDNMTSNTTNYGYGALTVGIKNDTKQSPLLVAARQDGGYSGANRLFAMELLNSGAHLYFGFGGATKFRFQNNGVLYATGGMYTDGFMTAKAAGSSSDARLKTNIRSLCLPLETLMGAPSVAFDWKDGKGRGAGTIAQYWRDKLPEVLLTDPEGFYSVSYGQLAHVEICSLAKHLVPRVEKAEDKIIRLERRVAILEKALAASAKRCSSEE